MKKEKLNILWTNADPITSEKMLMMYAINAKKNHWWKEITIIIWGATAKLVSEDELIQRKIKEAIDSGIHVSACKACADELEVTQKLEEMGIETKYWGEGLTEALKGDSPLLTI